MTHAFGLVLALGLSQTPAQVEAIRKLEKEAHELQRAGRYADAEKPLQAAIDLWRKYRGPDDVEVLNDTADLAVAKRRKGDPVAAAALLEKVVEGFSRCKDPDAPQIKQRALNNLAAAYKYAGQPKKAQATWEAVLEALRGAT
ncbi:MAG TPA: tetratricopeptide repeat protein [Myxococcaceae bacterium]